MAEQKDSKEVEAKGTTKNVAPQPVADRILILKYNGLNIFTFCMVPPKADIQIMPKNNFIKESDWNAISKSPSGETLPMVAELFVPKLNSKNEFIAMMEWVPGNGPEDTSNATKKVNSFLVDLKPNEALKTVFDTLDVKVLGEWLGNEKRPEVHKAIQMQLQKMSENPYKKQS